jgi:large subunit ribosomal protein L9
MKILLRRDIPNVGLAGEVVDVKQGYARNYLIPHYLGVEPTDANMKMVEEDKRRAEEERRLRRVEMEQKAEKLKEVEVTIAAACNPEGHLYGSVGPKEIAAALREQGHEVEPKQIQMNESIRHLDTVSVPVVFAESLSVEVKVWVVRESGGELEEELEEEKIEKQEPKRANRRADNYGFRNSIDALETDL